MTIATREGRPAVNVKDDVLWAHDSRTRGYIAELPQDVVNAIYEGVREDFWHDVAPDIAREHGYSGTVYSEGRSGGWLVLADSIDLTACEPCYGDDVANGRCAECERWTAFASAIEAAQNAAESMFVQRLAQAVADLNARREACIVRGEN